MATDDTGFPQFDYTPPRKSFMDYTMAATNPPWSAMGAYRFTRSYRTLLKGGFESGTPVSEKWLPYMRKNVLNPKSWGRYSDVTALTRGEEKTSRTMKMSIDMLKKSDSERAGKLLNLAEKAHVAATDEAGELVAKGRFTDKAIVSRAFAGINTTKANIGNARYSLSKLNPDLYDKLVASGKSLDPEAVGQTLSMSSESLLGGYFGGFAVGARGAMVEGAQASGSALLGYAKGQFYGEFNDKVGSWAAKKAILKYGSQEAAQKAGVGVAKTVGEDVAEDVAKTVGRKIGAKTVKDIVGSTLEDVLSSDATAQTIPVIGQIYAVGSMVALAAKIGTEVTRAYVINPGIKNFEEGMASIVGQSRKSPFGMGFQDNSVIATSRQRGVQAIQNSRLNYRSALGQEGWMMAARYG